MPRRTPPPRDPADDAVDEIYRAPLDAFVDARKRLAAALKREGRPEASVRVAALAKPSASAWAVNQVYWQDRPAWEEVIDAGDRLRVLQQRMLAGQAADMREATADRQKAVHAAVERALDLLRASGNAATDATRQRIAVTFDAVAAYGSQGGSQYAPGRLTSDLDPPGFAALMALEVPALRLVKGSAARPAPTPAPSPAAADGPTATADRKEAQRLAREREAEARRVLGERKAALAVAEREAAGIEAEVERAAKAASAARERTTAEAREVERARKALAEATKRHEEAEEEAAGARATHDEVLARLDAARRRVREARDALQAL